MAYVLNEDQQLLKNSAAEFVKKECPLSRLRALRDNEDADGFSRPLWARMAELGWPAIVVPEAYGGLGMGMLELCSVLEEFGRNMVPEPLFSSALLGGSAIALGGNDAQKQELLPAVADGSLLTTLAYHERGSRYNALACETVAEGAGAGWRLRGEKTLVFDGHCADKLVVSAREKDGGRLALFVVDAGAPGLELVRQQTMHVRNHALVGLKGVEVAEGSRLECADGAEAVLARVIDRATVGLAAEMLGNAEGAFAMTLDYLKTRKQFGVLIGTFQALKHRAAELFTEIELARSAVLGACDALDRDLPNAAALVSVAKARCSDTAVLAGYEGIQMHGGIGMTDEHDIGFYAKRVRASELTFGDAAFHRDRFAELSGF